MLRWTATGSAEFTNIFARGRTISNSVLHCSEACFVNSTLTVLVLEIEIFKAANKDLVTLTNYYITVRQRKTP